MFRRRLGSQTGGPPSKKRVHTSGNVTWTHSETHTLAFKHSLIAAHFSALIWLPFSVHHHQYIYLSNLKNHQSLLLRGFQSNCKWWQIVRPDLTAERHTQSAQLISSPADALSAQLVLCRWVHRKVLQWIKSNLLQVKTQVTVATVCVYTDLQTHLSFLADTSLTSWSSPRAKDTVKCCYSFQSLL